MRKSSKKVLLYTYQGFYFLDAILRFCLECGKSNARLKHAGCFTNHTLGHPVVLHREEGTVPSLLSFLAPVLSSQKNTEELCFSTASSHRETLLCKKSCIKSSHDTERHKVPQCYSTTATKLLFTFSRPVLKFSVLHGSSEIPFEKLYPDLYA